MGQWARLCWLGLLAQLSFAQESTAYRALGTPAGAAQVQQLDSDLAPTGLAPPGAGSVAKGRQLYAAQCQHCHGAAGQGGLYGPLALTAAARAADSQRGPFAADPTRPRVVANFWPFASTLYDYIRRAMPQLKPGTLSNDEAYALTAYVLFVNELVDESAIVDGPSLQRLAMPARGLYEFSKESEQLQR